MSRVEHGTIRSAGALATGIAATGAYGLWQLVVEQKFFLHTLLVPQVSTRRVPHLPLGYRNVLELKLLMLWQQLRGETDRMEERRTRVHDRIGRRLEASGVPRDRVEPIREYQCAELDPKHFYRHHVRKAAPCVIRGFYRGDLQRFRLEALARRFPDAVAQVVDTRDQTVKSVTLLDVQHDGRRNYIPQQALLDQDPELRELFELDRGRAYFPVLGLQSRPVASFLIIGLGRGLNASFHCEESPNWYIAVSGSKRWTLVEAQHSWLLYPAARGDGMRRFADFEPTESGAPRDRQRFGLVAYAPRMEFELHAGDVLYFPAWMWHKTVNLDDEGLGVTCRYACPAPMSNRYFRAAQLLSPAYWRTSVRVVAGKLRGDTGGLEDSGGFNEQELAIY